MATTRKKATARRMPREAEQVHADETRNSRDTQTWDDMDIHGDFDDLAGDGSALPVIPSRSGFDSRWIRTKIGGEDDPVNISRSFNRGWRRRDPDTLPANFAALRSFQEGVGESIGVSGMVLMERPKKLSTRFKDDVKGRTDAQMRSVDENLFKGHTAGSGIGAPRRIEDKSEVVRGSPMSVDAD